MASGVVKLYKLLLDGRRQITGFLLPGDFLGLVSAEGFSCGAEPVTEVGADGNIDIDAGSSVQINAVGFFNSGSGFPAGPHRRQSHGDRHEYRGIAG